MKKWILCAGVAVALFLVSGWVNAQGRHPMGPRMGGRDFGPGPRAVRGPHGGGRFESDEGENEAQESPFISGRYELRKDRDEEGLGEDKDRFTDDSEDADEHREDMAPQTAFERHHEFRQHLAALVHRVGPVGLLLIAVVAIPVLIVLFWVLPITLGVRIARRKKLSPLWMLFGIHPLGGWIACLVLALSKGNLECPDCGGYVRRNFRKCPFCHGAVPAPTPPNPAA